MARNKAKSVIAFCLGILLTGILVQAAGAVKADRLVFPGVPEILRAFWRLLGEAKTYRQVGTTLMHLLLALALSSGIGIAFGLAQGFSDFVRSVLRPVMSLFRAIPMIVLTIIVMVLTRYENVPVTAATLILTPLVAEAASEGCRRIERELIDVYRMNSRLNLRVLFSVHLPLMAGYLKQAYVNAVGMGIKLIVTTEYLVQARDSLGKAVFSSAYFSDYADIYGYALIMILLVLLVSALPRMIGTITVHVGKKCRQSSAL